MFKNEPDLLTRKQCQDLLHIKNVRFDSQRFNSRTYHRRKFPN